MSPVNTMFVDVSQTITLIDILPFIRNKIIHVRIRFFGISLTVILLATLM